MNLSRNRGHQNALLAGMATAVKYADMIVTMDADLQDDINAVDRMIDAYYEGKLMWFMECVPPEKKIPALNGEQRIFFIS